MNYDKIHVFTWRVFTFITVEHYSRDVNEDLWRTWNFRHRCDLFNDEIQNVIRINVRDATISTSDSDSACHSRHWRWRGLWRARAATCRKDPSHKLLLHPSFWFITYLIALSTVKYVKWHRTFVLASIAGSWPDASTIRSPDKYY